MRGTFIDMTSKVGELGMYSYDRPAWTYWNAAANALLSAGYTQAQAFEILRSKDMRWMLDGGGETAIENLAVREIQKYLKTNKARIDQMVRKEAN